MWQREIINYPLKFVKHNKALWVVAWSGGTCSPTVDGFEAARESVSCMPVIKIEMGYSKTASLSLCCNILHSLTIRNKLTFEKKKLKVIPTLVESAKNRNLV